MELLLLWLDDLDDLIFSAAVSWRMACRLAPTAGFPAALLLTPLYGSNLHAHWTIALGSVAAGSVVAWLSAAVPAVRRPLPRTASPA